MVVLPNFIFNMDKHSISLTVQIAWLSDCLMAKSVFSACGGTGPISLMYYVCHNTFIFHVTTNFDNSHNENFGHISDSRRP